MRFRQFGFLLTAILGLGSATPEHQALTFAQLDGGQYENTLKPPRQFSLAGRWGGATPNELDAGMAQLGRLLDRDRVAQRQPLVLTAQAQNCGVVCGEPVQVQALYSQGMEGNIQELPSAAQGITFTNYLPVVLGPGQGVALNVQTTVTNANAIMRRTPDGVWRSLSTGLAGGGGPIAYTIAPHPNGTVYVGGDFTNAGGSGADYAAIYDPITDTFSVISSATAFNNIVRKIAIGPNGIVYLVGDFTNAGGIAAADFIVSYNPVTGTLAALGTGASALVVAVAVAPNGQVYAGGLNTSDFGGVAATNGAGRWDGSAWNAMSTGLDNGNVQDILVDGTDVYYVGTFTGMSGVASTDRQARWTGSAWASLTSGATNNSILSIVKGPNGLFYMAGQSTTIGGIAANRQAAWNKVGFVPLGTGLNNSVQAQSFDASGILHLGGLFTTANSITLPDSFARWNGATYIAEDVDLPGTASIFAITVAPDGTIYVGFDTTGSAIAAGVTTAPNGGTAGAYPRLTITGPTSGTSRIYQLVNYTTGAAIYLNLTMAAGEKAVLALDPKNITFVSTFQGNVLSTILPGSNTTSFLLQPGDNTISCFAASSSVTAVLDWQIGYVNLNDALQMAVP